MSGISFFAWPFEYTKVRVCGGGCGELLSLLDIAVGGLEGSKDRREARVAPDGTWKVGFVRLIKDFGFCVLMTQKVTFFFYRD